jgi:hypothetical protein
MNRAAPLGNSPRGAIANLNQFVFGSLPRDQH